MTISQDFLWIFADFTGRTGAGAAKCRERGRGVSWKGYKYVNGAGENPQKFFAGRIDFWLVFVILNIRKMWIFSIQKSHERMNAI